MSLYFDPYKNKPCRSIRAEVAEEDLAFIDEVIPPRHVRKRLATALATLSTKRDRLPSKKHGNEPL